MEKVFRPLHCGVKQIYTIAAHRQTVALMVSYDLILCDFCGVDVYREFFGKPNSSPNEVRCAEQLPVSAATSSLVQQFLNEATIDSVLLVALEDQATDRVLLSAIG